MEKKTIIDEPDFMAEQLLYNSVMYLPLEELGIEEGSSLEYIISKTEEAIDNPRFDEEQKGAIEIYIPTIKSILADNETLGQCEINDISWLDKDGDGKQDHPPNGLQACTFTNPTTGDTFVTFRGTPAGAWIDNAKMLLGQTDYCKEYTDSDGNTWEYMSAMQVETLKYMDALLEKYGDSWFEGGNNYLLGHSKGGNEATLAMMMYEKYFDYCLAMDGPGYSKELLAEMRAILGKDQFDQARSKMYGLNAADDYVHCLGISLIPADNIRWFQQFEGEPVILANHYCTAFYDAKKGLFAPFVNGPGPVARFVGKVSQDAMELPDGERASVFMSMMGFLQAFQGKALPVNASQEDWLSFFAGLKDGTAGAVEVIGNVLINTEEGMSFCLYLYNMGVLDSLKDKCDEMTESFRDVVTVLLGGVSAVNWDRYAKGKVLDGLNVQAVEALMLSIDEVLAGVRESTRNSIESIQTQENSAAGKKIAGINYTNTSVTGAIVMDASHIFWHKTDQAISGAMDKLYGMKYWQVSTASLLQCRNQMGSRNKKLLSYQHDLQGYANAAKKAEDSFIAELNKK